MNNLGYINNLADTVHDMRTSLRLSQAELAKRAGVSRHTVINIESGELKNITLKTAVAVLGALGLELRIGNRVLSPSSPMDDEYVEAEHALRNRMRAK